MTEKNTQNREVLSEDYYKNSGVPRDILKVYSSEDGSWSLRIRSPKDIEHMLTEDQMESLYLGNICFDKKGKLKENAKPVKVKTMTIMDIFLEVGKLRSEVDALKKKEK